MIYTTEMLINKFSNYSNPKSKIKRLCNEGRLTHIAHNVYSDKKNIPQCIIHSFLCAPSYVSFSYVLSIYGIIPEFGVNLSCASYRKNKNKTYDTKLGFVYFMDIPKKVFPYGVKNVIWNDVSYCIAIPEKALCDLLYKEYQASTYDEFKYLLFEDLRVDEYEFMKLDFDFICEIAPMYKRRNLDFLKKYINEEARI